MPDQITRTFREAIRKWAAEFRSAAHADKLSIFRDHLKRLQLPNRPGLLLEDTIQIVIYCSLYAAVAGRYKSFLDFLKLQRYDPGEAPGARYVLTFDIHGKSYARVLVDSRMCDPDLADLYNHPWRKYKSVGYGGIWITRVDWRELTKKDKRLLRRQVEYDLRFDYSADEVVFWFDDTLNKSALYVNVGDHLEPDENGNLQEPEFLLTQLRYIGLLRFMRREKLSPKKLGASRA